ncbi:MAG TPA: ribonuclease HI [Phycisphaerales bacterium]|nr:ribonuclease HI [Phycisphaerales bacterium]HMP38487.1 ribonuclease HI [Phycisphaerales bacterium]
MPKDPRSGAVDRRASRRSAGPRAPAERPSDRPADPPPAGPPANGPAGQPANWTEPEALGPGARSPRSVEIFTDGACTGNPGPGGWAYILRDLATGRTREGSGGDRQTTNNRMELTAAIEALAALRERCAVTLYSDSEYVVRGLNEWMSGWKAKGWRRGKSSAVANAELWKELDRLKSAHDVKAVWVRGHAGHPENTRCDELAVAAAAAVAGPESGAGPPLRRLPTRSGRTDRGLWSDS